MRSRRQHRGLALAGLVAAVCFTSAPSLSSGQPPAGFPSAAAPSLPLEADGTLQTGLNFKKVLRRHRGTKVKLSNESSLTRWTYAVRGLPVRSAPSRGASRVASLRITSNHHARLPYIILQGVADARGKVWLQVRVPGRPNGQTGWAPVGGFFKTEVSDSSLVVDRSALRITLYRDGKAIFRAPVGIGAPATPTPGGNFVIEKRNGPIFGPVFGTHILFTTAYSSLETWPGGGLVGIHGTNEPSLVPGRPSHGCVRLHNADINRLYRLIRVGTPLQIR